MGRTLRSRDARRVTRVFRTRIEVCRHGKTAFQTGFGRRIADGRFRARGFWRHVQTARPGRAVSALRRRRRSSFRPGHRSPSPRRSLRRSRTSTGPSPCSSPDAGMTAPTMVPLGCPPRVHVTRRNEPGHTASHQDLPLLFVNHVMVIAAQQHPIAHARAPPRPVVDVVGFARGRGQGAPRKGTPPISDHERLPDRLREHPRAPSGMLPTDHRGASAPGTAGPCAGP